MRVALLSGGTGGAKLARGLLDVVGSGGLTVIANTGDDAEAHGVHVCPDPDLVTYWLATRSTRADTGSRATRSR
ncbi:MAG: YvcK family protein [Thermoleophilaceae bacterium]|nr:YvcK family protein [Thermoleophilaceae bacterium]